MGGKQRGNLRKKPGLGFSGSGGSKHIKSKSLVHKGSKRQGLATCLQNGNDADMCRRPSNAVAPPRDTFNKQLAAQRLQQKREELRKAKVHKHRGVASTLQELIEHATQTGIAYNQQSVTTTTKLTSLEVHDNSRRAYMKELRKVVDRADVILEVLDARDPLGCRTLEMEEMIGNRHGKKIILVLNKIDLVPPSILQPWLSYLRTSYPTVAFKATTQQQSNHLSTNFGRADRATGEMVNASKAVGTDALMQLLKNYCRNAHLKTAITVGVIGYPNVGKSSVINSLKRSKAASVSSTAGHTKVMQEIHIDSKIKLLDCPGIVFDSQDANALLLRNCLNTETMEDPVGAVQVVLTRCDRLQLDQLYGLQGQTYNDVIEFLVLIAQSKGKLGKGGIPDRQAAARIVLQDWNRGKIPFYTPPPSQKVEILDTQVLSSYSEAFDVDAVLNPTRIFMEEEREGDEIPTGPVCSLLVDGMKESTPSSHTIDNPAFHQDQMRQVLRDSDSDSDSDIESDLDVESQDVMYRVPDISLAQLTSQHARTIGQEGAVLAARRRAKQWRKLKRRAAKQHIGVAAESDVCDQLIDMMEISHTEQDAMDPDL